MRFLAINDIHTSDRSPRYRTEAYNDDVFAKLVAATNPERVGKYDFIIVTGDLFHNPRPSKVSHALVNRWLTWLDTLTCPILMVGGNHDLASGRIESLPKQPLGTLTHHRSVDMLIDGVVENFIFNDQEITVAGVSWNYAADAEYIKARLPGKVDVLVLHVPLEHQGNPHYFTIHPKDLTDLARVVVYGHGHISDKPFTLGGTLFVNPGALSRGSIAEDDAKHKPMIAAVNIDEKVAEVE